MKEVVFIDTSVLLSILNIPGKNQDHTEIVGEFKSLITTAGNLLILPVSSIIETGNHVAQLPDGGLRRQKMEALCTFLVASAEGTPPWVIGDAQWNPDFILALVRGLPDGSMPSLVELATQGVGVGDAAIVHEMAAYKQSINTPSDLRIRLWTLDAALSSYAN